MSDLKVDSDFFKDQDWSPGEWVAWLFSPLNFWKVIKVRVVFANWNVEASLQSRIFRHFILFQDLMVAAFQL